MEVFPVFILQQGGLMLLGLAEWLLYFVVALQLGEIPICVHMF